MAFLITVMVMLRQYSPMREVLTQRHLHDMGKFCLALVMVWAYFSFSQFLIIWAGNLPEEIPFFLRRMNHGWGWVGLALVFGHFALPFALLLSRDLKRNFKLLRNIALFILVMPVRGPVLADQAVRLREVPFHMDGHHRAGRNDRVCGWPTFSQPATASVDPGERSESGGGIGPWTRSH